jgi:cytochrome c heme-lyase
MEVRGQAGSGPIAVKAFGRRHILFPSLSSAAVSRRPIHLVFLPPSTMGQTASQPTAPAAASAAAIPASCPMHQAQTPPPPAQCPIAHDKPAAAASSSRPAECPIKGDVSALNQMPVLAQTLAPGQAELLPTERVVSSIPRDTAGTRWEYPSPQQFHNALARKGWETPEEHVETMVEIHNFLNEQAWQEVLKWEARSTQYVCSRSRA